MQSERNKEKTCNQHVELFLCLTEVPKQYNSEQSSTVSVALLQLSIFIAAGEPFYAQTHQLLHYCTMQDGNQGNPCSYSSISNKNGNLLVHLCRNKRFQKQQSVQFMR